MATSLTIITILIHLWAAVPTASDYQPGCHGLPTPNMEAYSREGDMVFGILAAVHEANVFPSTNLLFTDPPVPRRCEKIHIAFYQSVLAMVFAINEINKIPNFLPNITLGFRIYDSCHSEMAAIGATLQQLSGGKETIPNYLCQSSPKMAGFIGDGPSTGALPMANILGVNSFPQISYVASLPILSDKVQFPSFLRTVASASFQADALVQLLLHFGWTWIGIVTANNDLGLYSSQMLKEAAAQNKICIDFFETLPTQINKESLARVIGIVQKSTAKVIVCYTYVVHITPILKEISLQGITSKIWIGVTTWVPSTIFSRRDLWGTLNGTLALAVYSAEIPGFNDFFFNIHPLKDSEDIFIRAFWEQVFNCKFVDSFSEMRTENMTDGETLCTGTEKLQSLDASVYEINYFRFPFSAYIAIYALAQALEDLILCKHQEGPFANRSCADAMDFQPWQMLHYVKNVHITASSGSQFFFDTSGEFPALLDLLYWHMTSNDTTKYVKVGTYNASAHVDFKLVIDESAIFWGGKHIQVPLSVCSESCTAGYRKSAIIGRPTCCFHCVPCPDGSIANQTDAIDCIKCPDDHWSNIKRNRCLPKEIDFLPYEDPLGFILAVIAIFLFFNASFTLGIFIKYRQTPLVRANNLQLSYILLVALMMCFLCSLIFIGRPKRVTCMLRQVIFGISFSFCVSCVMAKTITVLLAFKATKPNSSLRQWVGSRTSNLIVLSCSFIEFAIGVIWLGTSPPFPELNNSAGNWKIIAECNEGSILMFYCILAFMGLLACVTFGIAFLARNLPNSFNEAKYITFSMLVFVSVWLSFIPAYLSTKGKYLVAVEIFAILSSGAGLLYCIFAPKIYIIFLRPEMNTREYLRKTLSFSISAWIALSNPMLKNFDRKTDI
ncbi:extracellular calcium-sensing receptor-like [Lissotriton helveticus]